MRGFDFDRTLFRGFSFKMFCFYSSFRRLWLVAYVPVMLGALVLKALRLIDMKRLVEIVVRPYIGYRGAERHMRAFWEKNYCRISEWFKRDVRDTDLVISAAPKFFLEIPCAKLGVKNLIATEFDPETKKIIDPYCYKSGKVKKFEAAYGEGAVLDEYYTDSMRDRCMLDRARSGYIVKNFAVTKIK